ncbi:hypothetical protein O3M35_009668 [Rhynocoris fuscipes]|uniref:Chitin-binding type-2 domain-containing protein n=1 Tax=Rhynocoris fuscipes TaxID=488301 RepID=A0AAW1D528_9HEMI
MYLSSTSLQIILLILTVTISKLECAPQEIKLDLKANTKLDNVLESSSSTVDNPAVNENITTYNENETRNDETVRKYPDEPVQKDCEHDELNGDERTASEEDDIISVDNPSLLNSSPPTLQDIEVEEALRNERDLRQALAAEQQLIAMARSTDDMCNNNMNSNNINCNRCDPNINKLKCYNDTAVALCTPSGYKRLIRCTGATPVCHPTLNVCSTRRLVDRDIINSESSLTNSMIKCPEYNAYYPDMNSCKKFYYCANGKPYKYKCATNEVYNPLTRSCALQTLTTPCRRFSCEGNQGRYAIYPGDASVYVLCSNNRPIEMFHCPEGQAMQIRSQQCETECTREGLIPDYTSCRHYYECTARLPIAVNRYKITRRTCPPNMVFSPIVQYCVPQEQYQDCDSKKKKPLMMLEPPMTTVRTYETPTTTGASITTSYTTVTVGDPLFTTELQTEIPTTQYIY